MARSTSAPRPVSAAWGRFPCPGRGSVDLLHSPLQSLELEVSLLETRIIPDGLPRGCACLDQDSAGSSQPGERRRRSGRSDAAAGRVGACHRRASGRAQGGAIQTDAGGARGQGALHRRGREARRRERLARRREPLPGCWSSGRRCLGSTALPTTSSGIGSPVPGPPIPRVGGGLNSPTSPSSGKLPVIKEQLVEEAEAGPLHRLGAWNQQVPRPDGPLEGGRTGSA